MLTKIPNKKIIKFRATLLEWYELEGRHFPWRNNKLTQYQIIIAEILLQRTKAETISKFYKQFLRCFPNWITLANSELRKIKRVIKPIGLYRQRAKRLKCFAMEMIKRNSKLPKGRAELESLPFIGQYIANSIELLIYKKPSPLLDVNMARLLERYFGNRRMADIRYDDYLQNLAFSVVKIEKSKEINWAILDYAALICKARKPICEACKLKSKCLYYRTLN